MEHSVLLKQIWGGSLGLTKTGKVSSLEALLTSLVNVPVVSLVSDDQMDRPVAFMESATILDDVSLGDILAEELGIEVPYGAMVLVQPRSHEDNSEMSPAILGDILGRVLLDVATHRPAQSVLKKAPAALGIDTPVIALSDFSETTAGRLQ